MPQRIVAISQNFHASKDGSNFNNWIDKEPASFPILNSFQTHSSQFCLRYIDPINLTGKYCQSVDMNSFPPFQFIIKTSKLCVQARESNSKSQAEYTDFLCITCNPLNYGQLWVPLYHLQCVELQTTLSSFRPAQKLSKLGHPTGIEAVLRPTTIAHKCFAIRSTRRLLRSTLCKKVVCSTYKGSPWRPVHAVEN